MDYQNVLSNEFRDLDLIAKKEKEKYISAYPFPHITIKNFDTRNKVCTLKSDGRLIDFTKNIVFLT